jgi:DNA invertase Pin-like site-specific DNA recombinase
MEVKTKAAAYARVSTLSEAQEFSLIRQTEHYREYIQNNPEYEFAGVYADQMSGKSVDKRKQFNLLLKACRDGDVKLIITKSISRFARNLCETLEIVRELRMRGIGVLFEKESLNTLDPTSDLRLSLYAGFAENELKSHSGNLKWAARKRYQSGEVEFNVCYGYRYLGDKKHEIIPEEAAIVKEIFERYINGEGARTIAVSLNGRGVKKKVGSKPWVSHDVLRTLTCEKYTGNAILQKTVSENFKKTVNTGQVPQYYVANNHPAIISQELFDKANEILSSRKWSRDSVAPIQHSPFTGKIKCGCCGTAYNMRKRGYGKYKRWGWECARYSSSGKATCPDSRAFRDDELKEIFLSAYNEAVNNGSAESKPVRTGEALKDMLAQERELSALRAKGYVSREAYLSEQAKLVREIKALEAEYAEAAKCDGGGIMKPAKEYSDGLVKHLETAKMDDLEITFTFRNGAVMRRFFNTYRRRNLKQNNMEEK